MRGHGLTETLPPESLAEFISDLTAAVETHTGTPFGDDLAALLSALVP